LVIDVVPSPVGAVLDAFEHAAATKASTASNATILNDEGIQ